MYFFYFFYLLFFKRNFREALSRLLSVHNFWLFYNNYAQAIFAHDNDAVMVIMILYCISETLLELDYKCLQGSNAKVHRTRSIFERLKKTSFIAIPYK